MSAWLWFNFILGAIFNFLCTVFLIESSKALLRNYVTLNWIVCVLHFQAIILSTPELLAPWKRMGKNYCMKETLYTLMPTTMI